MQTSWRRGTDPHDLVVKTTSGIVHGILNDTYPGVRRFLSIPYAAPPVGTLRWEPPKPYIPNGAIHANRYGPACPQFTGNSTDGFYNIVPGFNVNIELLAEDCLTVSVYAPVPEDKNSQMDTAGLPVFIWIYGGGERSSTTERWLDSLTVVKRLRCWWRKHRKFLFTKQMNRWERMLSSCNAVSGLAPSH